VVDVFAAAVFLLTADAGRPKPTGAGPAGRTSSRIGAPSATSLSSLPIPSAKRVHRRNRSPGSANVSLRARHAGVCFRELVGLGLHSQTFRAEGDGGIPDSVRVSAVVVISRPETELQAARLRLQQFLRSRGDVWQESPGSTGDRAGGAQAVVYRRTTHVDTSHPHIDIDMILKPGRKLPTF